MKLNTKKCDEVGAKSTFVPNGARAIMLGGKMLAYSTRIREWDWIHKDYRK